MTCDLELRTWLNFQALGGFLLCLRFYFQLNSTVAKSAVLNDVLYGLPYGVLVKVPRASGGMWVPASSGAVVCITGQLGQAHQSCCSEPLVLSDDLSA